MTKEEIKQRYSMRDIAGQYGFHPNRAGFISCPFHSGDRDASMKIYDRDFHCFGCGANGDIFDFIQRMDSVDFKEAFQSLGGTYEKPTFASKLAVYRAQKRAEMRQKKEWQRMEEIVRNSLMIGAFRWGVEHNPPLSDAWCENYNRLQYQLYLQEELTEER
ncbi:MAG: DNA primase [Clostridiales bacterium]|nr:DNA primase [Clostridiales bacterium]